MNNDSCDTALLWVWGLVRVFLCHCDMAQGNKAVQATGLSQRNLLRQLREGRSDKETSGSQRFLQDQRFQFIGVNPLFLP